jgi:hypothetical protein
MTRFLVPILAAALGVSLTRASHAAPQDTRPDNAALLYWQAFALMPESKDLEESLEKWDRVELDGRIVGLLKLSENSLKQFHAGATIHDVDWGLDRKQGPELLLPYLARSRDLSRLALLRARYRFSTGDFRGGIDDATATLQLGQHVTDPIVICMLVQYLIQNSAIETIAHVLPEFDRTSLDELARRLDAISADDMMRQAWQNQSKYTIDWVVARLRRDAQETKGDQAKWVERVLALPLAEDKIEEFKKIGVPPPEKLIPRIELLKTFFKQMEVVTDLPFAEQDAKLAELENSFATDEVGKLVVPRQGKILQTRRRWQARRTMLNAAVAVQREGEGALKDARYADPFGSGPFVYRKTDGGGFELQSRLTFDGKPVTVTVGGK